MNRRNFSLRILSILLAIFAIAISASCSSIKSMFASFNSEGKEWPTYILDKTYIINSADLIETLQQGKSDVFILLDPSQGDFSSFPKQSVEWSQSDYFYIMQALNKYIWNDSLDGWLLKDMKFGLYCNNISSGAQSSQFLFFKVQQTDDDSSRLERLFIISTEINQIIVNETKYDPNLENITGIDLTKIKINVNDALQIAELNGGEKFRNETNNNCAITAEIRPDDNREWLVWYSSGSGDQEKSFKLDINALTGDYKKVH